MRCSLSGPLAAALLLAVASVPCPAAWLDDTTHNVGVEDILAPRGTVDSGQTIIPRIVVANYGDSTESLWAHFAIDDGTPGGFLDSLWLTGLAPAGRETVAFPNWVPRGRDSMTATAWTVCAGDSSSINDTFRLRFFVRVRRYSMTFYEPGQNDTLRVGDTIVFKVRVWNFGNTRDSGYVRFRVGPSFVSTSDTVLLGGVLEARDTFVVVPGIFGFRCSLFVLPEDSCVGIIVDTFVIRGTITTDVDARAVLAPTGVVDTTQTIMPEGRFGNLGNAEASFWTYFRIKDASGVDIYSESCQAILSSGDSVDIEYLPIKFSILGNYTAICSTAMPGDQNSTNDVKYAAFRVVARVTGDIGIVRILAPDTLFEGSHETLSAVWRNYGNEPAMFNAFYFLHNRYGVRVYSELLFENYLEGGASDTLFAVTVNVGNDTGRWTVRCSTAAGDTNFANDTLSKYMYVLWRPGTEEGLPQAPSSKPEPTILAGASGVRILASCVVFDAMGRRVVNPKPGVYFVCERSAVGGERSAVGVRKVVIQR